MHLLPFSDLYKCCAAHLKLNFPSQCLPSQRFPVTKEETEDTGWDPTSTALGCSFQRKDNGLPFSEWKWQLLKQLATAWGCRGRMTTPTLPATKPPQGGWLRPYDGPSCWPCRIDVRQFRYTIWQSHKYKTSFLPLCSGCKIWSMWWKRCLKNIRNFIEA